MSLQLSWDLFLIVFFIVTLSYSFIIGKNSVLKVILGTYIAFPAADAVGSLFGVYFSGSAIFQNLLSFANVSNESEAIVFVKVAVFVLLIVFFAVKGAYRVNAMDDASMAIRIVLTVLYAFMSATLIISVILIFISGVPVIGGGGEVTTEVLTNIFDESKLIETISNHSYFLFAAPAFVFLFHSLYYRPE